MRISEMKINNKLIDEAKLNGQIVYRLDRDRTPPKVLYTKIQLYYPLVYPSNTLYPSKDLYPRSSRDLHHAYIGDTIYIEFQVDEELKINPTIKLGNKEFASNLLNNNIYNAYITLTDDLNLPNNSKIQIIISNLIDISNNKADDYITQGNNEDYVILDNNFILNYTDKDNISHSETILSEELLKNRIQELKTVQEGNIVYQNLKTCKIISNGIKIKDCSNLFGDCQGLVSVDLSDLNTSETTTMEDMFYSCNSLQEINLDGINTSKVKNMKYMFGNCYAISQLNLSMLDTSQVTDMSNMFYECIGIEKIDMSKCITTNLTNTKMMFYIFADEGGFRGKINEIDISSMDFSKVTQYDNMFGDIPSNCLIYVKDQTSKNFILNIRNDFTNIQIKEE